MKAIIECLDNFLTETGRRSIAPPEANALLEKKGLLRDSVQRPGLPLRNLLREGRLPHAFQSGGKGSYWIIPHSSKWIANTSNYPAATARTEQAAMAFDISGFKKQYEKARQKYKPDSVKYLLIAEAPPNSIERFFYYENVRNHDHLFLGVAQALYPDHKKEFLASGRSSDIKSSILLKLKADGFYLLDLSELPCSLMRGDLHSQLPPLVERIERVADKTTKIILIKASVYDTAFRYLQQQGFENVVDVRIPFPASGQQNSFQTRFHEALELVNFFDTDDGNW